MTPVPESDRSPGRLAAPVLLVTPPLLRFNLFAELGVPQIVGYLEAHGVGCSQVDLNVELLYDFLTRPPWPERVLQLHGPRSSATAIWEQHCSGGQLRIPRHDIEAMRSWVESCAELLRLLPGSYRPEQLMSAVERGHPPYEALFEERLFAAATQRPAIIGLTLMSSTQLLPGLILARRIKVQWPDTLVVAGGPWVIAADSILESFLSRAPALDALVVGRAEEPLLKLCEAVRGGGHGLDGVPNLVLREGERIRRTPLVPPAPLDSLPDPSFDGLRLGSYPVPMLPVQSTNRCYWGKCVFCHHDVRSAVPDRRSPRLVVDAMLSARDRYRVPNYFLADCATPLDTMESISEELLARRERLRWSALARADDGYSSGLCRKLRSAGCRALLMGLETVSAAGLQKLRKGITAEMVENAVRRCGEAGIGVYLFVLDYPGNSLAEFERTLDFVLSLSEWIEDFIPARFQLSEVTRVASEPELFSLRRTVRQGEWLDVFDIPYEAPDQIPLDEYNRLVAAYQARASEKRARPRQDPFYLGTLD